MPLNRSEELKGGFVTTVVIVGEVVKQKYGSIKIGQYFSFNGSMYIETPVGSVDLSTGMRREVIQVDYLVTPHTHIEIKVVE